MGGSVAQKVVHVPHSKRGAMTYLLKVRCHI